MLFLQLQRVFQSAKRALVRVLGDDTSDVHPHPDAQTPLSNDVPVTVFTYEVPPSPPPPPPPQPTALRVPLAQLVVTSTPGKEYAEEFIEDAGQPDERIVPKPPSLSSTNTSSPIHNLHAEIFVRIFELALGLNPNGTDHLATPLADLGVSDQEPFAWKQFVALGSTCHFWRSVLHDHFRIVPFPDATNIGILNGLLNSMNGRVVMVDTLSLRPHHPESSPRLRGNQMERSLQRIRVLALEREFGPLDVSESFCYSAPVLQSFTLTGTSDTPPYEIAELFRNRAPALREITLSRCYLSATSPLLANLTSLSLSYLQRAPEDAVYGALRAARNLVSLELIYGLPLVDEFAEDEALVEFPHLQRLNIRDQDGLEPVMRFFWHLRAPSDLQIGLPWDQINIKDDAMDATRVELKDTLEVWRRAMRAGEETMTAR
ncbi:hypothetical protein HGRIS_012167 [Hohenbuehelia grisea]|uniref:F-box domain-containing protein n=1 Tax=Hohenbuehelia grisea TaxID=104357 RepID=A0ABR3IRH8_9AGAR